MTARTIRLMPSTKADEAAMLKQRKRVYNRRYYAKNVGAVRKADRKQQRASEVIDWFAERIAANGAYEGLIDAARKHFLSGRR